jgi:hypothetical protein
MGISRRAPGQRLRRTRREQELNSLEESNPEKYAELIELRRVSPQAYRKELQRLIKKGAIVKGRAFRLNPDDVEALNSDDLPALIEDFTARAESGELDFRRLFGLAQEEKIGRARPDLMALFTKLARAAEEREGRKPI